MAIVFNKKLNINSQTGVFKKNGANVIAMITGRKQICYGK